jgi:hypothetical protein
MAATPSRFYGSIRWATQPPKSEADSLHFTAVAQKRWVRLDTMSSGVIARSQLDRAWTCCRASWLGHSCRDQGLFVMFMLGLLNCTRDHR